MPDQPAAIDLTDSAAMRPGLAAGQTANPRKLGDEELQRRLKESPHFKALMDSYWRYVRDKGEGRRTSDYMAF